MTGIKPELMECTKCGSNIFKIRVTPYGNCGSDIEWVCAKCKAEQGGIFNDPLNEISPEIFGKSNTIKGEIIKSEDGIDWIKFALSPKQRLKRFGRLLPDLFLPDFWDGEKTVYDSLSGRWETFIDDLKEGLLGYWVGCKPSQSSTGSANE